MRCPDLIGRVAENGYIKVTELDTEDSIQREIMLVRVRADSSKRREVLDTAQAFTSKVLDVAHGSIAFEVTGSPRKLSAFLDVMHPYGVTDLAKSGRIAMARDGKAAPQPNSD